MHSGQTHLKLQILLLLYILIGTSTSLHAADTIRYRVAFYNVENLFDTHDDPTTDDNEFLPQSTRRWTKTRLRHKIEQIGQAITALGEWGQAELIGLCEIENDSVLHQLTRLSPLRTCGYRYVIGKQSDGRGIRNALLYQPDRFRPFSTQEITIPLTAEERPTRPILTVSGTLLNRDTLDLLIVHLPSRRGGEARTAPFRQKAIHTIARQIDSLNRLRSTPNIILMGDFNLEPDHPHLRPLDSLIPLFDTPTHHHQGSYKYNGTWEQIDQIRVSPTLLNNSSRLRAPDKGKLFAPAFLLEDDTADSGKRPFRTYHGFRYIGGYSDHLPIYVDLTLILE